MFIMDIWEKSGLKDLKALYDSGRINVYHIDEHGLNQELYFSVEYINDAWKTYLIQRGKKIERYSTVVLDFAKISACFLFAKYFLQHLWPCDWNDIDLLLEKELINEAFQTVERKFILPLFKKYPNKIKLLNNNITIQIVCFNTNSQIVLAECSDFHQALRAYRNYSVLFARFTSLYELFISDYPKLTYEYVRLLKMFLT